MAEYTIPTWLYHSTEEACIFYSEEEAAEAVDNGWSIDPAIQGKGIPMAASLESLPPDVVAMDLEALRAYARDLGLTAGARIKLETLQARVASALAEKA